MIEATLYTKIKEKKKKKKGNKKTRLLPPESNIIYCNWKRPKDDLPSHRWLKKKANFFYVSRVARYKVVRPSGAVVRWGLPGSRCRTGKSRSIKPKNVCRRALFNYTVAGGKCPHVTQACTYKRSNFPHSRIRILGNNSDKQSGSSEYP